MWVPWAPSIYYTDPWCFGNGRTKKHYVGIISSSSDSQNSSRWKFLREGRPQEYIGTARIWGGSPLRISQAKLSDALMHLQSLQNLELHNTGHSLFDSFSAFLTWQSPYIRHTKDGYVRIVRIGLGNQTGRSWAGANQSCRADVRNPHNTPFQRSTCMHVLHGVYLQVLQQRMVECTKWLKHTSFLHVLAMFVRSLSGLLLDLLPDSATLIMPQIHVVHLI